MLIATYRWGGKRYVGVVSADRTEVSPLALEGAPEKGALALIEHVSRNSPWPRSAGPRVSLAAVTLEAPIPRPSRNIFCVGRNYRAHAQELAGSVFSGQQDDAWPIVFTKLPDCVIGPREAIRLPHGVSNQIDYEAELAVVIGVGGKNISATDAMRHVWGYTIVNDVTARDVQMRHQQWDLGKSFDTFCPMGPYLVSADQLNGQDTEVRCFVNDELRQKARTTDLIFDIPTLIETCSRGITLFPGDIIATGTPSGVGMGMTPPRFLQRGDRVRVEIDGIGVIDNPVE